MTEKIPEGWKKVKLGGVCTISRGSSPRPIQEYISKTMGTPWIKISDATSSNNRYIVKTKEFIKKEGEIKSRIVYPGDLIVSNSATPGLPRFVRIRACIHDGWLLLRDFKGINKEFFYYLILTERERILIKGNGSIFTNLKTDILKNHTVYIPPLSEQKAIASVLSSLDDKIDLLHRQNKTLEDMAQTLFRKWFIEDAKEDWEEVRLNKLVTIKYGKNLPTSKLIDKGYPVFGGNGLIGYYNEYLYDKPQVLISCRGAASGKVIISLPFSYITNNSLILEIKKDSLITFEYLKYYALSTDFTVYISGSAQPQITINDLSDVVLLLPKDKFIIEKFTKVTSPNEIKILNNIKQIRTLEKLRDTLLPKLMSGEVRVKY